MYEVKYRKYITHNFARFATEEEIVENLTTPQLGAGIPLYFDGKSIYLDDKDNHSVVIGHTGCGKSRAVCKTLIYSLLKNSESVIVNDPKSELYKATAGFAKQMGYDVQILNFRNPEKTLSFWNPLAVIKKHYDKKEYAKASSLITELSNFLMASIDNGNDKYWQTTAKGFLAAIIEMCLWINCEDECYSLKNILSFINVNENNLSTIRKMTMLLPTELNLTKSTIESVIDLPEKTKSCVFSEIQSSLNDFLVNESLMKLFSCNDIDFEKFGKQRSVLYIIYPDEKKSLSSVVNAFLMQAYASLLDVCEATDADRLPVRVNFVIDEFSNLPALENFDNKISEARSKNIRYHLFIQSFSQLQQKYKSTAWTILSNATDWVIFSNKEFEFLSSISKLCGSIIDYNGCEKPLISVSEMQYLQKNKTNVQTVILRQGVRPYVTNLPYFDCTEFYKDIPKVPDFTIKKLEYKVNLTTNDWYNKMLDYLELDEKTANKKILNKKFGVLFLDEN